MLVGLMNVFFGVSIGYFVGIIYFGLLEKYKKFLNLVFWVGVLFMSVFCLVGKKGFFFLFFLLVYVVDINFF